MAPEVTTPEASTTNGWVAVALGLLAGIAVLGTSVFLVAVLQAPIGPPVEAAPLFVWNTTAAVIAYVLLRRNHVVGYAAAILTGVLVVLSISLIGSGAYGQISSGSSPLGPLSYVSLAVGLIAVTVVAWRRRGAIDASPNSTLAPE